MIIFFTFLLNFLFFINTYCQQIIVKDFNGNRIPYAKVVFKNSQLDIIEQKLTNQNGLADFSNIQINNFPIYIEIYNVGYEKLLDTIYEKTLKEYQLKSISLEPVVITAQYIPTTLENSIYSMKVINNQKIEKQAAVNLRDLLRTETNIRIFQDPILGSKLTLQGISGQNVKILIDGVPIIGRLDGNIDISQINLNNVDRVEITEGPLSVNYGTDALAGTINIITNKEYNNKLSINSYFETVHQYNMDGRFSYLLNKSQWTVSAGRNFFDGWNLNDPLILFPKPVLADTSRFKLWKPKEQYFANFQYLFKNNHTKFRFFNDYFYEKITHKGFPLKPYYETAFDDYYKTLRLNNGIDFQTTIKKIYKINLLASHNYFCRNKNTYFIDLTTLHSALTPNSSDQDTSKFHLWMSRGNFFWLKDSSKVQLELGYDINYETAYGKRIEDQQKNIADFAFFSTLLLSFHHKLVIKPAFRFAYNSQYKAPIVPSLHLKYQLKSWVLRASYARGFRAPTLKELFFEFVDINHNIKGSQSLKAEQSHNFQAFLSRSWTKSKYILKMNFSGFYNTIHQLITLAQKENAQEYTYVNIGNFKTHGFQSNVDLDYKNLKFHLGMTINGIYNQLSQYYPVNSFSYSPEFKFHVDYSIFKSFSTVSLFYKYTGRQNSFFLEENGNLSTMYLQGFHYLDGSFTKDFFQNRLTLVVGVKNILNIRNLNGNLSSTSAHSSSETVIPMSWGRSYFILIKLKI